VAAYRRTEEARRLRQLEEAKTEFINLVSHELRTPLTVIRGYMAMIREGDVAPGSPQFERVLPILGSRVEQVAILVEQMIDAARLEGGDGELVVTHVDLRDVVTDVMLAVRRPAGDPHLITYDLPTYPVPVEADRHRLIGILEQLIDNAVKYSPAGGEISLTLAVDDDRARIEVADHGIGIAEADLSRLFTRFGRLVTPENSHVLGAGLGLYLAREAARRLGGDIGVRSHKGVGSVFTLSLPLADSASETAPEPAPRPAIS
jgi:signal transduction histidine kinase